MAEQDKSSETVPPLNSKPNNPGKVTPKVAPLGTGGGQHAPEPRTPITEDHVGHDPGGDPFGGN